jgi:hypothetical protein
MGEQAMASMTIFGGTIRFMVIEPTAVVDGPTSFAGTVNDGAQAFHVPLLLGAKITPVDGVGLPGLPEIRAPLSVVTGDSEVATDSEQRAIDGGSYIYRCGASWCVGRSSFTAYAKTTKTASHVDAIVSGQQHVGMTTPGIPLFDVGPFSVELSFGVNADIGTSAVANDRVLGPSALGLTGRSLGDDYSNFWFNDGQWQLASLTGAATAVSIVPRAPGATWPGTLAASNPFLTRALADDDRAVTKTNTVGLTGTLTGAFDVPFGPLEIKLAASGTLGVNGGQVHSVRDALRAEDKDTRTKTTKRSTPRPRSSSRRI